MPKPLPPPATADMSRLPALLRSLLRERGSLTRRLKALAHRSFLVRVEAERWDHIDAAEARSLGAPRRGRAWIREVALLCDGRPAVYARSVIPAATLRASRRRLGRMGTRPLGDLLFRDRRARRIGMTIRPLGSDHKLYERAARLAGAAADPFWSRQSLFLLDGHPLIVVEVFLSEMGR